MNYTHVIVGGRKEAAYPSVGRVAICFKESGRKTSCTGTLIAPQWFLTAAHCVLSRANEQRSYKVRFEYRSPIDNSLKVIQRDVECLFVHGEYDISLPGSGERVDIALFKLDAPVTEIKPAKVYYAPSEAVVGVDTTTNNLSDATLRAALQSALRPNQNVLFVGYGETQRYRGDTLVKHSAPLKINKIRAKRFTANVGPQGQMVCNGDSGGPAFVFKDDVPYVAGIVSTGDEYCKVFVVCTRIDRYVPLIANIIGSLDTSSGVVSANTLAVLPPLLNPTEAPNAQFRRLNYGVIQKAPSETASKSLVEKLARSALGLTLLSTGSAAVTYILLNLLTSDDSENEYVYEYEQDYGYDLADET